MTLDFLTRSRIKKRNSEISYLIPFSSIMIGKKIIEKASTIELSEALLNKNVVTENDRQNFKVQASRDPLKYYQTYKVCYQCYHIYSFIMNNHSMIPKPSLSTKNLRVNSKLRLIQSELGPLNKDNIDDLLLDMSYYLASCEMDCDDRVKQMYSSMTEISQSISKKSLESEEVMPKKVISSKRLTVNDKISAISPNVPNPIRRKSKRVTSIVREFYMGKPKKIGNRLMIK